MNIQELLTQNLGRQLASYVANMFIIEYGIIQKVISKGVVEVQLSVVTTPRDTKIITSMLINIASSTFTLNLVPEEGDKVLVLFPRRFSAKMCEVAAKKPVIDKNAASYNLYGSFAVLLNQYKEGKHKNFITLEKGKLDAQFGYNKDDDKTTVNVKTTDEGDIEVTTPKIMSKFDKEGNISVNNDKITIEMSNEGDVSFENENVTLSVKNDGTIDLTNGKAKVKIESSGAVTIDADGGKLTLKNGQTSLKDVITKIIGAVDKLATAGSPASHTAVPGQMAESQAELAKLM